MKEVKITYSGGPGNSFTIHFKEELRGDHGYEPGSISAAMSNNEYRRELKAKIRLCRGIECAIRAGKYEVQCRKGEWFTWGDVTKSLGEIGLEVVEVKPE